MSELTDSGTLPRNRIMVGDARTRLAGVAGRQRGHGDHQPAVLSAA